MLAAVGLRRPRRGGRGAAVTLVALLSVSTCMLGSAFNLAPSLAPLRLASRGAADRAPLHRSPRVSPTPQATACKAYGGLCQQDGGDGVGMGADVRTCVQLLGAALLGRRGKGQCVAGGLTAIFGAFGGKKEAGPPDVDVPTFFEMPDRVVAVGDVHGDVQAMLGWRPVPSFPSRG